MLKQLGGKYLCRREMRDFLPLVICNHPPSLDLHNLSGQQVERLNNCASGSAASFDFFNLSGKFHVPGPSQVGNPRKR